MEQEDVDSIVGALEDEYAAAYTRRDAIALAALFTDDLTWLNERGDLLSGRAELEAALASTFPSMPAGTRLVSTPSSARALTEDVLVSHGRLWQGGAPSSREETLFYTRVYVWRHGVWQLAASQTTTQAASPTAP